MARYTLTAEERETHIRTDDADGIWHVHTTRNSRMGKKVLKIALRIGVPAEEIGDGGVTFTLPLNAISFRVPRKATAAQREHLARMRAKVKEAKAPATLQR